MRTPIFRVSPLEFIQWHTRNRVLGGLGFSLGFMPLPPMAWDIVYFFLTLEWADMAA